MFEDIPTKRPHFFFLIPGKKATDICAQGPSDSFGPQFVKRPERPTRRARSRPFLHL